MEPDKYLTTYTADNSDRFWICGVEGCEIPFLHEVGITEDHEWKRVFADYHGMNYHTV